jgi:hypothetical protein
MAQVLDEDGHSRDYDSPCLIAEPEMWQYSELAGGFCIVVFDHTVSVQSVTVRDVQRHRHKN